MVYKIIVLMNAIEETFKQVSFIALFFYYNYLIFSSELFLFYLHLYITNQSSLCNQLHLHLYFD